MNNNELIVPENTALSVETVQMVSTIVQQIVTPLVQSIGAMLDHNTQAMEQIAAAQQLTSDRIAALEKQVRLNTPVTSKQVQYLNDAIRDKAKELLEKRGIADDKKAVTKMCNAIRKTVLAQRGIAGLREIPKHEYSVAMSQVSTWSNIITMQEIIKEARERASENKEVNQ